MGLFPLCRLSISIHALREEGDQRSTFQPSAQLDFNPRPPRGERRVIVGYYALRYLISIHALREESD